MTDFAPRFQRDGKMFSPMMLVRKVERISGAPTIRILLRPMQNYGAELMAPQRDLASGAAGSHIRYLGKDFVLRLTTDAPANAIADETPFALDRPVTLVLGPDEELHGLPADVGNDFLERTAAWWHDWVGSLTIPPDWRDLPGRVRP